jgi:SAM-dependent methyltransferase
MSSDPTERFSSRVEDYLRYRPSYPAEVIAFLERECGLAAQSRVADIGSGTGLLSELFLRFGCRVDGVEPNPEMRAAGERLLAGWPRFHSVAGRAEATTLPDGSADLVSAGQAFHWFDSGAARSEFQRILTPNGWVVLVWNERLVSEGFLADYEALLHRYSPDYAQVDHRRVDDAAIARFFAGAPWRSAVFPNRQHFDWQGLRGRVLSSSYVPLDCEPLLEALARLFERYQQAGQVSFLYETKLYAGRLGSC